MNIEGLTNDSLFIKEINEREKKEHVVNTLNESLFLDNLFSLNNTINFHIFFLFSALKIILNRNHKVKFKK